MFFEFLKKPGSLRSGLLFFASFVEFNLKRACCLGGQGTMSFLEDAAKLKDQLQVCF
jgi:hypothetical protein